MAGHETGWWLSSENVWLYGGWWNWVNGISAINIFCMTGWLGIYVSKDKKDSSVAVGYDMVFYSGL